MSELIESDFERSMRQWREARPVWLVINEIRDPKGNLNGYQVQGVFTSLGRAQRSILRDGKIVPSEGWTLEEGLWKTPTVHGEAVIRVYRLLGDGVLELET